MARRLKHLLTAISSISVSIAAFGQSDERLLEDSISIIDPAEIQQIEVNRRSMVRALLDQPYPIRRLIAADDIRVKTQTIKLQSGKKATLVIGSPKKATTAPAVFVIDVESSSLAADPVRWNGPGGKGQQERMKRIRYLLRSPFGSNLLGNGFVVAYLIAEDVEALRSARTLDWLESFEKVRKNKRVDDDSFFLLSTREYANLSLYLASHYNFSGVILEEPHYMLFSKNGYKDIINRSDRMTEDEIWNQSDPTRKAKYQKIFSSIHSPLLLVRSKNTSAYSFNEKTLIPRLIAANTFFEEATVDHPARNLDTLGQEGVIDGEPNVSYNVASTSQWLEHMLDYLKANSLTQPVELAMPYSNYRR